MGTKIHLVYSTGFSKGKEMLGMWKYSLTFLGWEGCEVTSSSLTAKKYSVSFPGTFYPSSTQFSHRILPTEVFELRVKGKLAFSTPRNIFYIHSRFLFCLKRGILKSLQMKILENFLCDFEVSST